MSSLQAIRGTKDILGEDARAFAHIEATARQVFSARGFSEIRTPTFEALELFERSIGDTTDVVQKEMYVFEDRGGRRLALRPEGTAGVVRAFVEHHLSQSMPFCKLFYIGPMFRAERPQAGRFREFWQVGAEYFGNASPYADAELILAAFALFKALGVEGLTLKLNNLGDAETRTSYRAALLQYLQGKKELLCEDCQTRMLKNPLRVLDCKRCGPQLTDAPNLDAFWTPATREHFKTLGGLLEKALCPYTFTPKLVRGLDYYNGTVFEVASSALGAQDALAGGGRYDTLVKELDGPATPAIGFALGIERLIQTLRAQGKAAPETARPLVFVAALGEAASGRAFQCLETWRQAALPFQFEGGFFTKKLSAQMSLADRLNAAHVIIFGEEELSKEEVTLRNMKTGEQKRIPIQQLLSSPSAFIGEPS